MRLNRHIGHESLRLPKAEEEAHKKEIEETFGKDIAKDVATTVPHYEDTRDDDRKQLVDRLRRQQ